MSAGLLSQEKFNAENYWNMPSERVIPPNEYGQLGWRQRDFLADVRDDPLRPEFGFDGAPEQTGKLRVAAAYMLAEDNARMRSDLYATDLTTHEYLEQRVTAESIQESALVEMPEGVDLEDWLEAADGQRQEILKPVAAQLKQRAGRISMQQVLWEKQHGLLAPSFLELPTVEGNAEDPLNTQLRERAKHHVLRIASKILKARPEGMSVGAFTTAPVKHGLFSVIGASNAIDHLVSTNAITRSQDGATITPTEYITNPRQSAPIQYARRVQLRLMDEASRRAA